MGFYQNRSITTDSTGHIATYYTVHPDSSLRFENSFRKNGSIEAENIGFYFELPLNITRSSWENVSWGFSFYSELRQSNYSNFWVYDTLSFEENTTVGDYDIITPETKAISENIIFDTGLGIFVYYKTPKLDFRITYPGVWILEGLSRRTVFEGDKELKVKGKWRMLKFNLTELEYGISVGGGFRWVEDTPPEINIHLSKLFKLDKLLKY